MWHNPNAVVLYIYIVNGNILYIIIVIIYNYYTNFNGATVDV